MQMLDNDWLTTAPIDLEYKKYVLLAYDQQLTKHCENKQIYPSFTDLIDKLKIVNEFLQNVNYLEQSKLGVTGVDIQNKRLTYGSLLIDPNFDEIKDIANYSRKIFADLYDRYRRLLDEVDGSVVISGCRVDVFNIYDGYIVLKFEKGKEKILRYEVVRILYPSPHFILKTYKADLKEYYTERYTKNIFDVIFKEDYPLRQSLVPVYKRKFLENLFGF